MIVRNVRSRSNEMSAHDAVNSPLTIPLRTLERLTQSQAR